MHFDGGHKARFYCAFRSLACTDTGLVNGQTFATTSAWNCRMPLLYFSNTAASRARPQSVTRQTFSRWTWNCARSHGRSFAPRVLKRNIDWSLSCAFSLFASRRPRGHDLTLVFFRLHVCATGHDGVNVNSYPPPHSYVVPTRVPP